MFWSERRARLSSGSRPKCTMGFLTTLQRSRRKVVGLRFFGPREADQDYDHDDDDDDGSLSGESTKSSFRSLNLPKPNISTGINRLFKGFKNFSQIFVYKEEMEDYEIDMEIGGPTDVKHVTHIGWDGSATHNDAVKGWENLITPDLLSVPSDPWRPSFEFPMAAQPEAPLVKGSAS